MSTDDMETHAMELESSVPKRLPPIRITIHPSVTSDFHSISISEELHRCKKVKGEFIKHVSFNKNSITIATDDQNTHSSYLPLGARAPS